MDAQERPPLSQGKGRSFLMLTMHRSYRLTLPLLRQPTRLPLLQIPAQMQQARVTLLA